MNRLYLLISSILLSSLSYGQTLIPDAGFGNNGVVISQVNNLSSEIFDMLQQPDGKIVAAGQTLADSGFRHTCIARYNTDGSLDNNFGVNGITNINVGYSEGLLSVTIQADGKLIAAGNETVIDTIDQMTVFINRPFLIRYKTDGTPDSTFGINGIHKLDILDNFPQSGIAKVDILPDGRIVVGGYKVSQFSHMLVVCLYEDGTYDTSFELNGIGLYVVEQGVPSILYDMAIQPDGKMVLAGYSGVASLTGPPNTEMGFIRVNTNGDLDNTFGNNGTVSLPVSNSTTPLDVANDVYVDANGKIIAAGSAANDLGIVRLNSDGTPDASFGQGGILLDTSRMLVDRFCLQQDGDILVATLRSNGNPYSTDIEVHQANANGTINTSFGTNGDFLINPSDFERARAMMLQDDGKILIGGYTTDQSGDEHFTIWRYAESPVSVKNVETSLFHIYPNPVSDKLTIALGSNNEQVAIELTDITGRTVFQRTVNSEQMTVDMSEFSSGVYMLQLQTAHATETFKIVKH